MQKDIEAMMIFDEMEKVSIVDQSEEYGQAVNRIQETIKNLAEELPEGKRQELLNLQDDIYLMQAESEVVRYKQGFVNGFKLLANMVSISNQFKKGETT